MYPAAAQSVPRARNAVVSFAEGVGASSERLEEIRLAVSEAMTNAVKYAYDVDPGEIEVAASVAGGELWVLIADDGCGLQADAGGHGLGLGLALIAMASDSFTIVRRSSGGIEVRVAFELAHEGVASEPRDQMPAHAGSSRARIRRT
jgi:anti-sigma regulatory factor (Ser/Thr protein kinase)